MMRTLSRRELLCARIIGILAFALAFLVVPGASTRGGEPSVDRVEFARDIAPLLTKHCVRCHQPGTKKGDLSLATASELAGSGMVVPGKPEESDLVEAVSKPDTKTGRPAMPKEGTPLTPQQVEIVRRWVSQGADWPKGLVLKEAPKAGKDWWSLQQVRVVEPRTADAAFAEWAANPIDRFVLAGLKTRGLSPSPPASKRTLIRRLTYDLTGLPPAPEEVAAFEHDPSPTAYEKLVDRLLASPRYGEQWGRHWLDVIRFGESRGYERNEIIPNAWPFRDYVIRSFNADKPFDALVHEHLTGDVIGTGKPDVEVGTTFLVCGPYDDVGNQDAAQAAVIRANTLDDVIRATSESFLGLTVGCARCHDHKFDPIAARDYYALYSIFAGVRHGPRVVATPEQKATSEARLGPLREREARAAARKKAIEEAVKARAKPNESPAPPTPDEVRELDALNADLAATRSALAAVPPLPTWWAGTFEPGAGPFHVFLGGDPQRKGPDVRPASLTSLDGAIPGFSLASDTPEGQRRLALARWLTDPRNPLTPRVLANRVWQYHFGTGIVDTPSDFGFMGGRPSHPELLDWLALQLIEGGWTLKPLHRLIVTSKTYQQSSAFREDAARVDGSSRTLWRFPPRRLTAEELRDTMLSVSGQLQSTMGGPGFKLYQYFQDNVATYVPLDNPGPETYRRAVYHHSARASYLDVLTDFDCPDNAFGAPRRSATTSPLQALTMMNHGFAVALSGEFASRLTREAGSDVDDQVKRAFDLAFGRSPAADELEECRKTIARHGLKAFCRVVLNASEMIYID